MIIEIRTLEDFGKAMKWVRTHRTIYGWFAIMLNGVVEVVLHYPKD